MNEKFFQILEKLSMLHIVPYYRWNNLGENILSELIGDIPYFISKSGNVFIGEKSYSDIKQGKICIQAHLDHPGGILSNDDDYVLCRLNGHGGARNLVGREFGMFSTGEKDCIEHIEVEHVKKDKYGVTLFFEKPENKNIFDLIEKEQVIVHQKDSLSYDSEKVKNWNLDDLINAAFIVYKLKYDMKYKNIYGLLTINEEICQSGIHEFILNTRNKDLFCISMDTLSQSIESKTQFGIRKSQSKVELDEYISSNIKQGLEENYFLDVPFGSNEGMTLIKNKVKTLVMFLKINNFHNGIFEKKFCEESININILQEYEKFVDSIVNKSINNNEEYFERKEDIEKDNKIKINIKNYSEFLKSKITECNSYVQYLNHFVPELRKVFKEYSINIPSLSEERFIKYKEHIASINMAIIDRNKIEDYTKKIIKDVNELFHTDIYKLNNNYIEINIIQLIMGGFNACTLNVGDNKAIAISDEKIQPNDIDRILIHELTHVITSKLWTSINMPVQLRTYYNEGLAIYISAKYRGLTLRESLQFDKEKYELFINNKEKLEKSFKDYLSGNSCELYKGNKHDYFISKSIIEPFIMGENEFAKYGYFLGAKETEELIEGGKYYERMYG